MKGAQQIRDRLLEAGRCLQQAWCEVDHPIANRVTNVNLHKTLASRHAMPKNLPVTNYLGVIQSEAPDRYNNLCDALGAISKDLEWGQTYNVADFGSNFLENYGWTILFGPNAPFRVDNFLSGFILLGPRIEYPRHSHSSEEIYLLVSGQSYWSLGDEDWREYEVGSAIYNPPWRVHGIRTTAHHPLLLAFAWTNTTLEKSRIV